MRNALFVLAVAIAFSACGTAPGPKPVEPVSSHSGANPPGPATPKPNAPGSAQASADAPTQPMDDKVAELRAKYDKNPTDAAVKKELTDATLENANYYMYTSPLPPNQKYPKALALYRDVVKLDPTNATAQESIQVIENIYRSLGKPIPETS